MFSWGAQSWSRAGSTELPASTPSPIPWQAAKDLIVPMSPSPLTGCDWLGWEGDVVIGEAQRPGEEPLRGIRNQLLGLPVAQRQWPSYEGGWWASVNYANCGAWPWTPPSWGVFRRTPGGARAWPSAGGPDLAGQLPVLNPRAMCWPLRAHTRPWGRERPRDCLLALCPLLFQAHCSGWAALDTAGPGASVGPVGRDPGLVH